MVTSIGGLEYKIDASKAKSGAAEVVRSFKQIKAAAADTGKSASASFSKLAKSLSDLEKLKGPSPTLTRNFSNLSKAVSSFKGPSQAAVKNTTQLIRALARTEVRSSAQKNLSASLLALSNFKGPTTRAVSSTVNLLNALSSANISSGVTRGIQALAQLTRSANTAEKAIAGLQTRLSGLRGATVHVAGNQGLGGVQRALHTTQASAFSLNSTILRTAVAFQGLFAILGAREVVQASADMQQISAGLEAVFGTVQKARTQLNYVRATVEQFGIGLQDASRGYMQLIASAEGSLFTLKDVRTIFTNMSQASRVFGLSAADTAGIYKALTQIISKGSLQMEELRGQLGDRIPGAVKVMADALDISTDKLVDLMKQGKITGEVLREGLVKFAEEFGRRTSSGVTSAVQTMRAEFGRLSTAFTEASSALGAGGFNAAVSKATAGLTSFLNYLQDTGALYRLGQVFESIVDAASSLGPVFRALADNFDLLAKAAAAIVATKLFGFVQGLFSLFTRLVPSIRLVTAALAGTYTVLELLTSSGYEDQIKQLDDRIKVANLNLQNRKDILQEIALSEGDAKARLEERIKTIDEAISKEKEYLSTLLLQAEKRKTQGELYISSLGSMPAEHPQMIAALKARQTIITEIMRLEQAIYSLQEKGDRPGTDGADGVREVVDATSDLNDELEGLKSFHKDLEQSARDAVAIYNAAKAAYVQGLDPKKAAEREEIRIEARELLEKEDLEVTPDALKKTEDLLVKEQNYKDHLDKMVDTYKDVIKEREKDAKEREKQSKKAAELNAELKIEEDATKRQTEALKKGGKALEEVNTQLEIEKAVREASEVMHGKELAVYSERITKSIKMKNAYEAELAERKKNIKAGERAGKATDKLNVEASLELEFAEKRVIAAKQGTDALDKLNDQLEIQEDVLKASENIRGKDLDLYKEKLELTALLNEELDKEIELNKLADEVIEDTKSPLENHLELMEKLDKLLESGRINQEQFSKAVSESTDEYIEAQRELDPLLDKMLGLEETLSEAFDQLFVDIFSDGKDAFDDFFDSVAQGFQELAGQVAKQFVLGDILGIGSGVFTSGGGILNLLSGLSATPGQASVQTSTGSSGGVDAASVANVGSSLLSAFTGGTTAAATGFATSSLGSALGLSTTVATTGGSIAAGTAGTAALTSLGAGLVAAAPYIAAALAVGGILLSSGVFGGSPSSGAVGIADIMPAADDPYGHVSRPFSGDNGVSDAAAKTMLEEIADTIVDLIQEVADEFDAVIDDTLRFHVANYENPESGNKDNRVAGYELTAFVRDRANERIAEGLDEQTAVFEALKFAVTEAFTFQSDTLQQIANNTEASTTEELLEDLQWGKDFDYLTDAISQLDKTVDSNSLQTIQLTKAMEEAGQQIAQDSLTPVLEFLENARKFFLPGESVTTTSSSGGSSGLSLSQLNNISTNNLIGESGRLNLPSGLGYTQGEWGEHNNLVKSPIYTVGDATFTTKRNSYTGTSDILDENGDIIGTADSITEIFDTILMHLKDAANDTEENVSKTIEKTQQYWDNLSRVSDSIDILKADVGTFFNNITGNADSVKLSEWQEKLISGNAAIEESRSLLEDMNEQITKANEDFEDLNATLIDIDQTVSDATESLAENLLKDFENSLDTRSLSAKGFGAVNQILTLIENRALDIQAAADLGSSYDIDGLFADELEAMLSGSSVKQLADIIGSGLITDEAALAVVNTMLNEAILADQRELEISSLKSLSTEIENFANAAEAAADLLEDAAAALRINPDLSPLSPLELLNEARTQFYDAVALANDDDPTDDESQAAIQKLPSLSQSLLSLSADYYASSADYLNEFNSVQDALLGTAGVQRNIAEEQLNQLKSIEEAIIDLGGVLDNTFRSGPAYEVGSDNQYYTTGNQGYASGIDLGFNPEANLQVYRIYQALGLTYRGAGEGQVSADRQSNPSLDAALKAVGLNSGGMVQGGQPGRDSVLAALTPGERVLSVEQTQMFDRLAIATNDLRPMHETMRAINESIQAGFGASLEVFMNLQSEMIENMQETNTLLTTIASHLADMKKTNGSLPQKPRVTSRS